MSEADEAYNSASYRSQYINSFCSQKTRAATCTSLKQARSDGRPAGGADKRTLALAQRPPHLCGAGTAASCLW